MPLLKGKQNAGRNIAEMERAGHPHDQSVAAGLRTAGVPPKKHGEKAPGWEMLRGVEAFSVGKKRGREYTKQDLEDIVENFGKFGKGQRPGFDVPAVYGHEETPEKQIRFMEDTGIPAKGWVEDARTDGKKLYLDLRASPELAKAVRDGHYGTVSIEIYDKPPEGLPGAKGKMMRRLAVLGGEIPQDKNLRRMPMPEKYAERVTRLRDWIEHNGYVTCFSEVAMPSHEEMVAKLAEHGFDPEHLKTHEGCMSEMLRMAETMKKGDGGIGDLDWDHEPEAPQTPEHRQQYAETAAKMSAYAEKLKKMSEHIGGPTSGDPMPGVDAIHPGPKGKEESGPGGPKESTAYHHKMSEELAAFKTEIVAMLKPVMERANESEQVEVLTFAEQMVKSGQLTPAQCDRKSPFNVIDELLGLDNGQVVSKFSENGRTVGLTARRKRMEAIKRGPKVWKNSEIAHNGPGGSQGNESAPDRGEAQIHKFCEDRFLGDDIKQELLDGWKNLKETRGARADVSELLNV